MLEINVGDVVQTVCGRDKFQPFVVVKIEGDFAFLANGKNRTINNPKAKKLKHVRLTSIKIDTIRNKLQKHERVLDSEIRKAIDNLNII